MFASESVCQSVSLSFQTGSGVRHVCVPLSLRRRPSRVARRYTNGGLLLNRAASANGKPAEGADTTDGAGDKDIIVVIEGAQQAAAATGPDGEIARIKRCRGDSDPSNAIVHRRVMK